MSITLPVVDLSSAVVGTSGTIPLQSSGLVAVPSQQPPFLAIYNDSGAGLLISLKKSQQQFYLSAKGHILVAISNSEGEIAYQVQNISTNIQVNQLWAVYFYPGEPVTDFTALGTSSVSQQATTLLNTGNAPGQNIIFSEPVGDSSVTGAVNLNNEGTMSLGDATYQGLLSLVGVAPLLGQFFPDHLHLQASDGTVVQMTANSKVSTIGGTAGSMTLYQLFEGNVKMVVAFFNGFRTTVTQNVTLPAPFTSFAFLWSGFWTNPVSATNCGLSLLSSGIAQGLNIFNAGGAFGSTVTTGQGTLLRNGIADCITGFDQLSIIGNANWTGNGSGSIVIIGS